MTTKRPIRVRFAPSPTGYLHIGGARTALYNYLFAQASGGTFILRIEDTDLERSKEEYAEALIADLQWLGIEFTEGPGDNGADRGAHGPYRQSERLSLYQDIAEKFIASGKAYYCFLSTAELAQLSALAESQHKAPHSYHGKYRDLPLDEAQARVAAGDEYVVRFKNPGWEWKFKDKVRGKVKFPADMVGDFVIMRSNGMPVYNFCCVVDDHLMEISHVIRAEEHLNNTVRQLMIYHALEARPPEFCHVSLLVGADRQKLSKRHGATSVRQYQTQNYLPQALVNYLCLLGWSHPQEKDLFSLAEAAAVFDLTRFNKAPAFYDIKKLEHFNAQHLKRQPDSFLIEEFNKTHQFNIQTAAWKLKFVQVFKEKLTSLNDIDTMLEDIFSEDIESADDVQEMLAQESTTLMKVYLAKELALLGQQATISAENLEQWMEQIKGPLGIKGKSLFMGLRVLLTGRCHGADLKGLLALTPLSTVRKRFNKIP